MRGAIALLALGLSMLAPAPARAEPVSAQCPDFMPGGGRCWSGRTEAGAYYWIVTPANWNGALVVHAHGGPRLGAPELNDPLEDLERFAVIVREGYAWAGTTYRRGGYGVRMAAEDVNQLRGIVWSALGRPRRTLLHGQSWDGNVAAKAAELYPRDGEGRLNWDGVLLTNGVLAGGSRAYRFRADLRVVYQYYCRNHPARGEAQYPLWQGLAPNGAMTRAALERRVQECTGVGAPARTRTAEQRRNLADILAVTGVAEEELVSHLAWATFTFRDLVGRLGGRNPFDNLYTRYSGSHDDAALNAGVERFAADPEAVAQLAYDADLTGFIAAPTLTIHAKFDPTAYVTHEAAYREVVDRAARSHLLLQTFTDERDHSRLSSAEIAAALGALSRWVESGERPMSAAIGEQCQEFAARYAGGCHFDETFAPAAFE